jgi:hypothetical protein
MPNLKRRLSRLEEATHQDYLRQLQAEGIDVEIPEEWQENSRALDIVLAGREKRGFRIAYRWGLLRRSCFAWSLCYQG